MEEVNQLNTVKGKPIDQQTRCVHYHSVLDVVAIKFKCCNDYYPCYYCHQEDAGHAIELWEKTAFETKAILCSICTSEMTIHEYKACGYQCPFCKAAFNPLCVRHDHLYFSE